MRKLLVILSSFILTACGVSSEYKPKPVQLSKEEIDKKNRNGLGKIHSSKRTIRLHSW